ncbi:MAG: YkgJ family cysteine cluster protein [Thermoplasmatota archaeon]
MDSITICAPGVFGIEVHERSGEDSLIERYWTPFKEGTRWKCIRCSWCCKQPWAVNLTWWEYRRLSSDPRAKDIRMDRIELDRRTGATHPYFVIEGKCGALREEGSVCEMYPDWPYTCATYPFLLLPSGEIMVHRECAGFGHGDVVDGERIRKMIIRERKRAGMLVK